MSRTKRGSKPSGYEYWSDRPNSGCIGGEAKTITHKSERMRSKQMTRNELRSSQE